MTKVDYEMLADRVADVIKEQVWFEDILYRVVEEYFAEEGIEASDEEIEEVVKELRERLEIEVRFT